MATDAVIVADFPQYKEIKARPVVTYSCTCGVNRPCVNRTGVNNKNIILKWNDGTVVPRPDKGCAGQLLLHPPANLVAVDIGLLDHFRHRQISLNSCQGTFDLNAGECVRLFCFISSLRSMLLMMEECTYPRPIALYSVGSNVLYVYLSLSARKI